MKDKAVLLGTIVILVLITSTPSISLAQPCEQIRLLDKLSLQGVVIERTLPGPPNYADVSRGDRAETYRFLELHKGKCIETVNYGSVGKSALIQLQFLKIEQSQLERALRGCQIQISGQIFAAASGHHHTPLLIAVEAIEVAHRESKHSPVDSAATPNHSLNRTYCGGPAFGLKKPSPNTSPPQ